MPAILISLVKMIFVRLATKYAAELVMKHTIIALEKAAANSETTIDDDIVAAVKKEQEFIVGAINGKVNG